MRDRLAQLGGEIEWGTALVDLHRNDADVVATVADDDVRARWLVGCDGAASTRDANLDVLVDMLAGGMTYRVLQPNPPTARQMKRYLESAYRQVGPLT